MQFTFADDAIERLGLPELKERVFDSPRVDKGYLAGFTVGELRWGRRNVAKVDLTQEMDGVEAVVLHYFLAIRRQDPSLLPASRFTDLVPADFEIVPHAHVGERAACQDCGEPVRALVHDAPETDSAF